MQPTDLTVEILKGIRDEVRGVRDEVGGVRDAVQEVRDEVRDTNARLGRLERRQSETEVRLSTEIVAVVSAVHELRDVLAEDRELRSQVTDHERRLAAVEARVR
jgi:chromosome segregation ATPase